jgi:DNA-binding transcriptional regulator YiaG
MSSDTRGLTCHGLFRLPLLRASSFVHATSPTDLRQRLKTIRKQRGLTQEQLARQADISTLTVSRLERGVQEP